MDSSLEQAASLGFALLRFETAAANAAFAPGPTDQAPGTDAFIFLPVMRRVATNDVVTFLASCPSPAIVIPSSTKGMIALVLLSEVTGERRRSAEHLFEQYRAALRSAAEGLGLPQPDAAR